MRAAARHDWSKEPDLWKVARTATLDPLARAEWRRRLDAEIADVERERLGYGRVPERVHPRGCLRASTGGTG